MTSSLAKSFTFALILCLGIMQLLLPFLHVHYNGDQVHESIGSQVLHLHTVEADSVASYLPIEVKADTHTHLVDRSLDSTMVNIDQAILNQEAIDVISFSAILFGLIAFVFATWFVRPASAFQYKQSFSYQRPLSHAPPHD
ncbi:MAG: hypothetical protein ACSHWN_10325 [Methylophilaceae bacterium]